MKTCSSINNQINLVFLVACSKEQLDPCPDIRLYLRTSAGFWFICITNEISPSRTLKSIQVWGCEWSRRFWSYSVIPEKFCWKSNVLHDLSNSTKTTRLSMGRSGPALTQFCWPWPLRSGPPSDGPSLDQKVWSRSDPGQPWPSSQKMTTLSHCAKKCYSLPYLNQLLTIRNNATSPVTIFLILFCLPMSFHYF